MAKFNLWRDEDGQSLIEYTLLIAFLALGAAALFSSTGESIGGLWASSNTHLSAASTAASGNGPAVSSGGGGGDHHHHH